MSHVDVSNATTGHEALLGKVEFETVAVQLFYAHRPTYEPAVGVRGSVSRLRRMGQTSYPATGLRRFFRIPL